MRHEELTPKSSTAQAKALLRAPGPAPWPDGWAGFPNVSAAFRELFDEAAGSAQEPPDFPIRRGIVIVAGGWRFFASLYVAVRMIRHVGCELPIQVWHCGPGEFDVRMLQALEPWGVGWIDGHAFFREQGIPRRLLAGHKNDGWILKAWAAAYCPFREVLSLDADCYPAYNPEAFLNHTEFQRVGAAFFPDNGQQLEEGQWERFGVPVHREVAWESGQFAVDKGRAHQWRALWLAAWLNDRADYVYEHLYGDKDTFHVAWRKLGVEVCVPQKRAGWREVAFLQKDFANQVAFIHRTRCKFRWEGDIDGVPVPNGYMTSQWGSPTRKVPTLPHEEAAHEFCRQSSELLRPDGHFAFRDGTWDLAIWKAVTLANEYGLPRAFDSGDVIVDIGGHIGSFAHACLSRGAGRVVTCEPDPGNLDLLRKNLARWGDRVHVIPAAVWPEPVAQLSGPIDDPANTGGLSVIRNAGDFTVVPTVSLAAVLELAGPRVRLLKVDCEGAEHMILRGADLSRVQHLVGEAHPLPGRPAKAVKKLVAKQFPRWQERPVADGSPLLIFSAQRS